MKIFLSILLLLFSFQSLTKADGVENFTIEGMSVGESLLDHFDKTTIDNKKSLPAWKSKKFLRFVTLENLNTYDAVLIYFINEKKNYKISSMSAIKEYARDFKNCMKEKEKITKEFKGLFEDFETDSYTMPHNQDKSGKSKVNVIDFDFNNGSSARIMCTDWSDEKEKDKDYNYVDELRVSLLSKEYSKFLETAWD